MFFATPIAALELVATRAQTCVPVVSCLGVFEVGQRVVAMKNQSQKSRKIVKILKFSEKGFCNANFATPIAALQLGVTRAQTAPPVVPCLCVFEVGQRVVALKFQSQKT